MVPKILKRCIQNNSTPVTVISNFCISYGRLSFSALTKKNIISYAILTHLTNRIPMVSKIEKAYTNKKRLKLCFIGFRSFWRNSLVITIITTTCAKSVFLNKFHTQQKFYKSACIYITIQLALKDLSHFVSYVGVR